LGFEEGGGVHGELFCFVLGYWGVDVWVGFVMRRRIGLLTRASHGVLVDVLADNLESRGLVANWLEMVDKILAWRRFGFEVGVASCCVTSISWRSIHTFHDFHNDNQGQKVALHFFSDFVWGIVWEVPDDNLNLMQLPTICGKMKKIVLPSVLT
jgi:hypothetical protein